MCICIKLMSRLFLCVCAWEGGGGEQLSFSFLSPFSMSKLLEERKMCSSSVALLSYLLSTPNTHDRYSQTSMARTPLGL